jgi:hypothetical protein
MEGEVLNVGRKLPVQSPSYHLNLKNVLDGKVIGERFSLHNCNCYRNKLWDNVVDAVQDINSFFIIKFSTHIKLYTRAVCYMRICYSTFNKNYILKKKTKLQ